MTKSISAFLACLHFLFGPSLFKHPEYHEGSPVLSYFNIVLAICVVVWSLPIYPTTLRKLFWLGNIISQYLIALFLIEMVMASVWSPLETSVINLPHAFATFLESIGLEEANVAFLKSKGAGFVTSYLLSTLILIGALHATRIINVGLLIIGPVPFIRDIVNHGKKFSKKLLGNTEILLKLKKNEKKRPEYCYSDDDDGLSADPSMYLTDPSNETYEEDALDSYCHYHNQ